MFFDNNLIQLSEFSITWTTFSLINSDNRHSAVLPEFHKNSAEKRPVTVAERSKACIVFARSEAGIVGSNPTQGMDV
jgi:hypothetical protein